MMTKEQYIYWRTTDPTRLLYHYYTTHEKLNHTPLDPQNLLMQLQMRGWNINQILQNIIQEYDAKYGVVTLMDKNGQIIKYL